MNGGDSCDCENEPAERCVDLSGDGSLLQLFQEKIRAFNVFKELYKSNTQYQYY